MFKEFKDSEGWEPWLYTCPTCGAAPGQDCIASEDDSDRAKMFPFTHHGREGTPADEAVPAPFSVRFEKIGPERAATLLRRNARDITFGPQKNRGNRNLVSGRIQRYAQEVFDGYWETTHQGIAFDEDGYLIDGQHRLSAIVKANEWAVRDGLPPIAPTLMVTEGVPRSAFYLVDAGLARQASQFLSGKYTTQRGGMARTILGLVKDGGSANIATLGKGEFPAHRLLHFLEDNAPVRDSVTDEGVYIAQFATKRLPSGRDAFFAGTSTVGLMVGGFVVGPERRAQWYADINALTQAHRNGTYADGVAKDNPLRQFHFIAPVGGNMTTVNYLRAVHIADRYRRGLPMKGRFEPGEKALTREWLTAANPVQVDISDLDDSALHEAR